MNSDRPSETLRASIVDLTNRFIKDEGLAIVSACEDLQPGLHGGLEIGLAHKFPDEILALILNKLPEKPEGYDLWSADKQIGWDRCEDTVRQILEGK